MDTLHEETDYVVGRKMGEQSGEFENLIQHNILTMVIDDGDKACVKAIQEWAIHMGEDGVSMISEQVKNLREIADRVKKDNYLMVARILNEAADTIEALSEKLSAKNMERSEENYRGEWIPCSERLPNIEDLHEKSIEDCKSYLIQRNCGVIDVAHYIKVYGKPYFSSHALEIADVIAWQPLPEPYNQP